MMLPPTDSLAPTAKARRTFLGLVTVEARVAEFRWLSHIDACPDCLSRRAVGGSLCVAGDVYERGYDIANGVYELAIERTTQHGCAVGWAS